MWDSFSAWQNNLRHRLTELLDFSPLMSVQTCGVILIQHVLLSPSSNTCQRYSAKVPYCWIKHRMIKTFSQNN